DGSDGWVWISGPVKAKAADVVRTGEEPGSPAREHTGDAENGPAAPAMERGHVLLHGGAVADGECATRFGGQPFGLESLHLGVENLQLFGSLRQRLAC